MKTTGQFISLFDGSMTLGHNGDPESDHDIADDATVTLNKKPATLAELQVGDEISLSGDPATSVTATRKQ